MAQLIVEGMDEDIEAKLQRRAARHGQSIVAEIRDILQDALKTEGDVDEGGLGISIAELFKGIGLKPNEEIQELRGNYLDSPFDE